jgi:hypothetical protein
MRVAEEMKRSLNSNEKSDQRGHKCFGDGAVFIEKYCITHAIMKFKLWLTVMGISCIYLKENAAYNVAISKKS